MSREADIEALFPKLRGTNWSIKSEGTRKYNCLAWAVGETHRRWDFGKGNYWPTTVKQQDGIAYLVGAYMTVGFVVCENVDGLKYEPEYDKIVLYELHGEGQHAAKLLEHGMWSSKLGDLEDIEHPTPEGLSGHDYGQPFVYMKRKKPMQNTKREQRKKAGNLQKNRPV